MFGVDTMMKNLQERRRIGQGVGHRRVSQLTSPEQLSPENETLERRNLKSILKKLSASSRAGSKTSSVEASSALPQTSTCTLSAPSAELRKLMRAPTLEGYAARHSKLSKSVTFNKYTLQSPPGNDQQPSTIVVDAVSGATVTTLADAPQPSTSTGGAVVVLPVTEADQQLEPQQQQQMQEEALEQQPLPPLPSTKVTSFRPLGSGAVIAASQLLHRPMRQDECIDELVTDIRDAVQVRLVSIILVCYC